MRMSGYLDLVVKTFSVRVAVGLDRLLFREFNDLSESAINRFGFCLSWLVGDTVAGN